MLPTPPASPKPSGSCSPEDRLGQTLAGRIQLTGILGFGAYGTVYQARDVETNVQYAVKALDKYGLDPRQQRFQDREIQLHYQASHHRNVVSMIKILDGPDCTFVVMEYCPEGDLFSKITDQGYYVGDDQKAKCVFLQILDAVRHCHAAGVYHRDLKPENILVQDNGWTVKLADFGLATQDRITSDFGCGSTFYMSPECQQPVPKPFACYESAPNDIWSLGVILVNLTCGRNPWKRASLEDSTFKAYMKDRNFLRTILPISDDLNLILQNIFEPNPQHRISLSGLREQIARCPRLTQGPSTATVATSSPPTTPPYSPVEETRVDSSAFAQYAAADVPPMDPLPGQQYPALGMQSPTHFFPSFPAASLFTTTTAAPICSPHLSPYPYATAPRLSPLCTNPCATSPSQADFIIPAGGPTWPRCGAQLFPDFHVPLRPAGFWGNVQAY